MGCQCCRQSCRGDEDKAYAYASIQEKIQKYYIIAEKTYAQLNEHDKEIANDICDENDPYY